MSMSPTSTISQFVFVGHFMEDKNLVDIFKKIESSTSIATATATETATSTSTTSALTSEETKLLSDTFTSGYKQILGLDNTYPKQYIAEFIERDDTIEVIKGKIQLHLDTGKYNKNVLSNEVKPTPMPISLQYLWAPNCHRSAISSKNTEHSQQVQIDNMPLGFFLLL